LSDSTVMRAWSSCDRTKRTDKMKKAVNEIFLFIE